MAMATQRKLQAEIDRVYKKVQEGVEEFEGILEKVETAANDNQKEKYEADLKKEIKKLQRLRDQIKTWQASNEVKDKKTLLENRKLIEMQMERFRAVERETKTKAYSKEGLEKALTKVDPQERARQEIIEWCQERIDMLNIQIDQLEAEIEAASTIKKKKGDAGRSKHTDDAIAKHKWHISRLEAIMRRVTNGMLDPEQVLEIQDDVNYYVEERDSPDYVENELLYDELGLDDGEDDDLLHLHQQKKREDGEDDEVGGDIDKALKVAEKLPGALEIEPEKAKNTDAPIVEAEQSKESDAERDQAEKERLEAGKQREKKRKEKEDLARKKAEKSPPPGPTAAVAAATVVVAAAPAPSSTVAPSTVAASLPAVAPAAPKPPRAAAAPAGPAAPATVAPPTRAAAPDIPTVRLAGIPSPAPTPTGNAWAQRSRTTSGSSTPTPIAANTASSSAAVPAGASIPPVAPDGSLGAQSQTGSAPSGNVAVPAARSATHGAASTAAPAAAPKIAPVAKNEAALQGAGGRGAGSLVALPGAQPAPLPAAGTVQGTSPSNGNLAAPPTPAGPSPTIEPQAAVRAAKQRQAVQNQPGPAMMLAPTAAQAMPQSKQQHGAQGGGPGPYSGSSGLSAGAIDSAPRSPSRVDAGAGSLPAILGGVSGTLRPAATGIVAGVMDANSVAVNNAAVAMAEQRLADMFAALDISYRHLPEAGDADLPPRYIPRNPYPTPPFYPALPPAHFDAPAAFERFDTDTLFFIFYYRQGTYHQYLAARELKKQAWRFHKKYMIWFQRHDEPQQITDEYEKGTYVFFDHDSGWVQRRKGDFAFEYAYLEDEELP